MALELLRAEPARRLLARSADSIRAAEEKLRVGSADYSAAAQDALGAVRFALKGMMIWHGASFEDGAPLSVLGGRARQLNSMLRTPLQRVRHLETVARAVQGKPETSLPEREAVRTGIHAARGMLATIYAQLPKAIVPTDAPVAA